MAESEDPVRTKPTFSLGRLVPLGVMAAALIAFFALDLNQYLNFGALKDHQETLSGFVASNAILAAVLFIVIYAVSTAISLPGGAILTIAGGFLFGTLIGTVYVVIGASLGATGLFLAARTALGEPLRARAGPQLQRMEKGFRENAFSYLLFLRLIPIFPFWLVNLVPAFLGVPIGTYFIGTLIGIIPGSFVFASVGNGLGALFAAGKTPDLGIIFAPDILIPIAGLGLLALVPVLYK
ncbi:MAG: TVP38/TMEM64 family protein, partial [Rhodospirillales bacterium]|nr:TVP38/TMEM64 family protein [Rhodospirillales bacterium]